MLSPREGRDRERLWRVLSIFALGEGGGGGENEE